MEKEMVIAFYVLFLVATIFDALRDAWVFDNLFSDGVTDFIDERSWHPFKNISRLSGWIAFYVLASGAGPVQAIIVFLFALPGAWAIWQMVYNRSRFRQWFVHHDFNLTALTMFRGVGDAPLIYRFSRDTMILICSLMTIGSAALIGLILRGF